MDTLVSRHEVPTSVWLVAGVLAIGLTSGLLGWVGGPLMVVLMVVGLVGGGIVLVAPILGVVTMFAINVLRPEAVQGLGWLNPSNLITVGLAGILFLSVVLGGPTDFLRSHQIRILLLIGAVLVVNWAVVGRLDPPGYLADKDFSIRTLTRYASHLAFVTFVIAFVRTPRHLLLVTGVFLAVLFVTIPGALAGGPPGETTGKVGALRAAAGAGGLAAAENANRLAFISLMGISIVWFALREYRSTVVRVLGGGILLALVLTVFRAGSRSGVLLLLLMVVLVMWQGGIKPGHIALMIFAGFVCVGLVMALVPEAIMDRILSVVSGPSETQTKGLAAGDTRRLLVFLAGLKLFLANPLMGVGIGNFRWMTTFDVEHGGISMAAHNAYLLVAAEGGLLLLAVYLLLFGVTARDLSRVLAQSTRLPEVGLQWLILATRTNLIMLLGISFFAEAWKEFYYTLILGTSGALVLLYERAAAARKAAMP